MPETAIKDRVRALRTALGLTQAQLGERVGMPRENVNHLESGRRKLSSHMARLRFADGLGVPVPVLDGYLDGQVSLDVVVRMAREAGEAA